MVFSQRPGSLLQKLSRGRSDEKKLTNDVQEEPARLSGGQLSASREPFQNNPDTEYSKVLGQTLRTKTRETVLAHLPDNKLLPIRIKVKDNDF